MYIYVFFCTKKIRIDIIFECISMCFFVLKKYVLFPKKHVEFSRKFNPNLGSGATFSAAMEG